MCLIIVKPKKSSLPSDTILANAWKNNGDGFGLAWADERCVHIRKGAMTLPEAQKLVRSVPDPISKDIIMHFRLATKGAVTPSNCHPYPISANLKHLQSTALRCNQAIAHNGHIIVSDDYRNAWQYSDDWEGVIVSPKDLLKDELTDTQVFIQDYLAKMPPSVLTNPSVLKLVEDFTGSKFALLTAQKVYVIGDFIAEGGLLYSNNGYKEKPVIISPSQSLSKVDSYLCEACGEVNNTPRYSWYSLTICEWCWKQFSGGKDEAFST